MFYTQSKIDRADHLRKDPEHLKGLRANPNTRLIPVQNNQSLTTAGQATPVALMLPADAIACEQEVFLGIDEHRAYFAVDTSTLSESQTTALLASAVDEHDQHFKGHFADLRSVGPLMAADEGALLAYARALIYWNHHTRHCSGCGHTLSSQNGGHVRKCHSCGHIVFPRTDPAVIMLVTRTPADGPEVCLLGRSPTFPEGVYSTLAGFVEPGETLEMAVQREVLEEASIHTTDVKYIGSQPWPFPRSIMLGFEARATSTYIQCDPTELADAQWFTREQLTGFGNWGDASDGYKLPRTDSIARHLINLWIERAS